jgi:hypothetical protein
MPWPNNRRNISRQKHQDSKADRLAFRSVVPSIANAALHAVILQLHAGSSACFPIGQRSIQLTAGAHWLCAGSAKSNSFKPDSLGKSAVAADAKLN